MSMGCDSDNSTPHYQVTPAETGRDRGGETGGVVEMNSYSLTTFLLLPHSGTENTPYCFALWVPVQVTFRGTVIIKTRTMHSVRVQNSGRCVCNQHCCIV